MSSDDGATALCTHLVSRALTEPEVELLRLGTMREHAPALVTARN